MAGIILRDYKNKKFTDIKGEQYKLWPLKTFEILKTYAKGKYRDYEIQNNIFNFVGSNVGIDEHNTIYSNR